jgi:hypothetical protein
MVWEAMLCALLIINRLKAETHLMLQQLKATVGV